MFSSIYTGLSGLLAFSKGLDVLSNNVANMNTPGFKGTVLAFRDMLLQNSERAGGNQGDAGVGTGVEAGETQVQYRQGELRQTGNALDTAIDGNGFFVLRNNGEEFYTRAGEFAIDGNGFLIERNTRARVAGLGGGTQLIDINILDRRVSPPRPTSTVTFTGNLSSGGTTHKITGVTVLDGSGKPHSLSLNFTNNNNVTTRSWLVEVRDEVDAVIGRGEIRYQGNGSPADGFNTVEFKYAPNGAPETSLVLNFGDPGSFSGSTNFSGGTTSDLQLHAQDGFPVGTITETSFNAKGELTVKYSNGQTNTFERLALARFDNPQTLSRVGNGLFQNTSAEKPMLDSPTDNGMGTLTAKSIELSNVELTEQFTDLVIVQRGYQASSQVISVSNEMLQQLMELRSR